MTPDPSCDRWMSSWERERSARGAGHLADQLHTNRPHLKGAGSAGAAVIRVTLAVTAQQTGLHKLGAVWFVYWSWLALRHEALNQEHKAG